MINQEFLVEKLMKLQKLSSFVVVSPVLGGSLRKSTLFSLFFALHFVVSSTVDTCTKYNRWTVRLRVFLHWSSPKSISSRIPLCSKVLRSKYWFESFKYPCESYFYLLIIMPRSGTLVICCQNLDFSGIHPLNPLLSLYSPNIIV